jgi:hypothetical protein
MNPGVLFVTPNAGLKAIDFYPPRNPQAAAGGAITACARNPFAGNLGLMAAGTCAATQTIACQESAP